MCLSDHITAQYLNRNPCTVSGPEPATYCIGARTCSLQEFELNAVEANAQFLKRLEQYMEDALLQLEDTPQG